jgi:peptidoglycan/LPS O-acetylase OafA/YrhL
MISIPDRFSNFFNSDLRLSNESSLGLDLIRGISAQMVLVGHALSYYQIYPSGFDQSPFYMQNFGVLVFFILSGFLITLTVRKKAIRNPSYNFSVFFVDRFVRIFSAYFPAIVLVFIIDSAAVLLTPANYPFPEALDVKTFIGNVFMLQDFPNIDNLLPEIFTLTSFGSARPFWTIAIEWWFYMFFGWVFFFKEIKLNFILKVVILLFFLIPPLYNLHGGRANCLSFLWYAGCILSFVYNAPVMKKLNKIVIGGMLVLLSIGLIYFLLKFNMKLYNYQIGSIVAAAILLLVVLFAKIPGMFVSEIFKKAIRLIADFSFSLYLIHYTILSLLCSTLKMYLDMPWTGFLCSFIICNTAALVFAYFTEFHHKQLRSYIFKKYKV